MNDPKAATIIPAINKLNAINVKRTSTFVQHLDRVPQAMSNQINFAEEWCRDGI